MVNYDHAQKLDHKLCHRSGIWDKIRLASLKFWISAKNFQKNFSRTIENYFEKSFAFPQSRKLTR